MGLLLCLDDSFTKQVHTWNGLNMKTSMHIICGTPFIAQCAYFKIAMPIKVRLLGYTVPSWTIA